MLSSALLNNQFENVTHSIIASTDDAVGFVIESQTSHQLLVSLQHIETFSRLNVPNANRAIISSRHASVTIPSKAGKTAAMAFECANDMASRKIPESAQLRQLQ